MTLNANRRRRRQRKLAAVRRREHEEQEAIAKMTPPDAGGIDILLPLIFDNVMPFLNRQAWNCVSNTCKGAYKLCMESSLLPWPKTWSWDIPYVRNRSHKACLSFSSKFDHGRTLAVAVSGGEIYFVDRWSGMSTTTLCFFSTVTQLKFCPTKSSILTIGSHRFPTLVIDLDTSKQQQQQQQQYTDGKDDHHYLTVDEICNKRNVIFATPQVTGNSCSTGVLEWSADGTILADACCDGKIRLYRIFDQIYNNNDNIDNINNRSQVILYRVLCGCTGFIITKIGFDPTGRYVAAIVNSNLEIWDLQQHQQQQQTLNLNRIVTLPYHGVFQFCFSPCGKYIATSGRGPEIHLWDISNNNNNNSYYSSQLVAKFGSLLEDQSFIYSLRYHPEDPTRIVATSHGGKIHFWQLVSNEGNNNDISNKNNQKNGRNTFDSNNESNKLPITGWLVGSQSMPESIRGLRAIAFEPFDTGACAAVLNTTRRYFDVTVCIQAIPSNMIGKNNLISHEG